MSDKLCKCGCGEILKNPKNTYVVGHSNRDPEVKLKKAQNFLIKHGVDNPSKLESIKIKKEETNLVKFGTRYAAQNEYIKRDLKEMWLEKYGVDNPAKTDEIRKKISDGVKPSRPLIRDIVQKKNFETFYNKLKTTDRIINIEPMFDMAEYHGVDKKYPFKCKTCDSFFVSDIDDGKIPRCFICNPKIDTGGQSILEKEISDYIKTLDPDITEQNRNIIHPLELDIVSEHHKIAVEVDGLYWHSETTGRKGKFYHFQKRKTTNDVGYRLLQIFEDEWVEKERIVKSRLKNAFGKNSRKIFARKCVIKEISTECKSKFLKKYHIQGNDKSNIHLGLFYKNRMVSVMTFNPYRIALGNTPKNSSYELARFCSVFNFSVIGGASKLITYFEKTYNPVEILSYADCRWSDGNLYKNLGFTLTGQTQPNYWYIVRNQRKHRFAYRKSELSKLLKIFDPNLTEWENMQNNGYDRIWDSGSYKFLKIYSSSGSTI